MSLLLPPLVTLLFSILLLLQQIPFTTSLLTLPPDTYRGKFLTNTVFTYGKSTDTLNSFISDQQGSLIGFSQILGSSIIFPTSGTDPAKNFTFTAGIPADALFFKKGETQSFVQWASSVTGLAAEVLSTGSVNEKTGDLYVVGHSLSNPTLFDEEPFKAVALQRSLSLIPGTGSVDGIVAKYNVDGTLQWMKAIGSADGVDSAVDIKVNSQGDVVLVGNVGNVGTFGALSTPFYGTDDIFVTKISSSGTVQWAIACGGPGQDLGSSVQIDANDNIFVLGIVQGPWFQCQSTNYTLLSDTVYVFIAKLDTSGALQYAQFYGTFNTTIASVSLDRDEVNNLYVSGAFSGDIDFGGHTLTSTTVNTFVLKLLAGTGNIVWLSGITSTDTSQPFSIGVNSRLEVYIAGLFAQNMTVGNSELYAEDTDGFVAKFAPDGTPVWARRIGGTGDDIVTSLAIVSNDRLFIGGQLSVNPSFDNTFDMVTPGCQFMMEMETYANCSALNACSGFGTCIESNVCSCAKNYLGSDCSFDCSKLSVRIRGGNQQIRRRDALSLIAVVTSCSPSVPNVEYIWERTTFDINPEFFNTTMSSSRLNFDSYQFPLGSGTYTFKFSVKMPADITNVTISDSVTIQVLDDDPVARIRYGNRRVAVNTTVYLSAAESYYPGASDLPAQYLWSCSAISPTGACPYEPLPTGSDISFVFHTAGRYSFEVTYIVGGRSSRYSVIIESIANSGLPVPIIVTDYYPYIATSWRVQFKAVLDRNARDGFELSWTLFRNDSTLGIVDLVLDQSQLGVPALNRKELVILPNVLQRASTYLVRFSVLNKQDASDFTYSELMISTSPGPYGGQIEVNPVPGSTTQFNISTSGWESDERFEPLRYSFEYLSYSGDWQKLTPFLPIESTIVTLPFSTQAEISVSLRVLARNRFEEESIAAIDVTIQPANFTNPSQLVDWIQNSIDKIKNDMLDGLLFDGELESTIIVLNEILVSGSSFLNNQTALDDLTRELIYVLKLAQDNKFNSSDPLPYEYRMQELQVLHNIVSEQLDIYSAQVVLEMLSRIFADNVEVTWVIEDGVVCVLNTPDMIEKAITIASSIAQLFYGSDKSLSSDYLELIVNIAKRAIASKVPGEQDSLVNAKNLDMFASYNYVTDISNSTIHVNQSDVVILPSQLAPLPTFADIDNEAGLVYLSLRVNLYSWMNSTSPNTPVLVFKILDQNESVIEARNLTEPITFLLSPLVTNSSAEKRNITYICKYYEEFDATQSTWRSDGCYFGGLTEDNQIICRCNHTTSFAAFIEYPLVDGQLPTINRRIFIASVAVNLVLTAIALPLIVVLFFIRGAQPARSRYLGPFVGLLAVLAECILQGIIRNSLLISDYNSNRDRANIIHHIVMIIVNPLSITAWFIFFWQHIRYYLLKHIYEAMARKQRPTILMARALSSSAAYLVGCLLVCASTFIYFLIFMMLRVTNVLTYAQSITIQSVSYFMMAMVIMVGVVVVFLWDMIFEQIVRKAKNKWKKVADQQEAISRSEQAANVKHYFAQYFWHNDPLRFRVESILMLATIVLAVVSYIIGINMQVRQKFDDGITIAQFIFDVLYLFMRILVFGVFVGCCSLINFIRSSFQTKKIKGEDGDIAEMIRKFIRDEKTYPIIHDYCLREFSLENLLLWKELDTLKPTLIGLQPAQRSIELVSIKERYLVPYSPLEVNIPNEVRKRFMSLCNSNHSLASEVEECVTALLNSVMNNVSDTWIRFETCAEYRLYLKAKYLDQKLQASQM